MILRSILNRSLLDEFARRIMVIAVLLRPGRTYYRGSQEKLRMFARASAVIQVAVAMVLAFFAQAVHAGQYDNAMQRTNYLIYSGDQNGDGRVDLFVKAVPKLLLTPIDDDLTVPIPLTPPSPTFVLLSSPNTTAYSLVSNPTAQLVNFSWAKGTYTPTYSGPTGVYADSMKLTPSEGTQPTFTVGMKADTGQLVLTDVAYPSAGNRAAFLSQSVPTSMAAGGTYTVSVTMKNTGSNVWMAGTNYYALADPDIRAPVDWGVIYVAVPTNVVPGDTVTIAFQVKAPATPGTYRFQWQMIQRQGDFFGDRTPALDITVGQESSNNSAILAQSVPSAMTTGQTYPIAVTVQNTGTSTWTTNGFALGSQNPDNNTTWGANRANLTSPVAPGEQRTLSFYVTAPAPGSYNMQWRMIQEGVQWFGAVASATVAVASDSGSGGGAGADVVTYIHTDGLGSPVARTDSSGKLIGTKTRYEPYGRTFAGDTSTIGFTGHVTDQVTGLVYMQQRYYDPIAGRFLSIDPVVTDANTGSSFNRYFYANNSPYGNVDPDGRQAQAAIPVVGGIILIGGFKYATDPKARAAINRMVAAAMSSGGNNKPSPAVGQGSSTTDGQRPSKTPNQGEPGSTYTNPGSGQEREYGADGKPVRDTDYDHDHGQGVPHIHDWDRDQNGKPVRGPGRPAPPKPPEPRKPEEPPKQPEPKGQ